MKFLKWNWIPCLALAASSFVSHAVYAEPLRPLETVDHVDVPRYMGVWYEIASFPKWFSKGCVNSQATYSLRSDGRVNVVNECNKGSADGRLSVAHATGRVVDEQTNAKLKVMFFWPFEGDYWIIDLGQNYEYAVVSEPSRQSLWILSRTKVLDKPVLDDILHRLVSEHGFDLSQLQYTRVP